MRMNTKKQEKRYNPYAKEVRTPKYRQRVEANKKKEYSRAKEKHGFLKQRHDFLSDSDL